MALISCPECAGVVSDKAPNCPHCGFIIEQQISAEEEVEIIRAEEKAEKDRKKEEAIKKAERKTTLFGLILLIISISVIIISMFAATR
ncbi:MAG: hypothetical protein P9L92_06020 [Candidatus Electryonea clarkiae]|nr:hypothetical protein [Candidatus Electryonea clarkiae]MDP8288797.1 hypothetical protein [Candidatus Electryonea clarkiae]